MSEVLHPIVQNLVDDWFLTSSEEDYLVARWANQNGIMHQYCWSAAQCIEKVIKAALLKAKLPTKDKERSGSHDLVELYKILKRSPMGSKIPSQLTLNISNEIIAAQGVWSRFLEPLETEELVRQISENGDPNTRYRSTPVIRHMQLEVHRLDALFLILRSAAGRPHIEQEAPGEAAAERQDLAVHHFQRLLFYLGGSVTELSKIITHQNLAFFPSLFSTDQALAQGFSFRANRYPIAQSNAEYFEDHEVLKDLDWLMENSRIPRKIMKHLKDTAKEIQTAHKNQTIHSK